MIKNIIYDLGNVLIKYTPENFLNKFIEEADRDEIKKAIFLGDEWLDMDRGVLSYEDAIEFFSKRFPKYRSEIKFFFDDNIEICLEPIKENVETLKRHREEGYNLYILSNFQGPAFENIYNKYEFFKNFHGKLVSYSCNMLKPEKEIFLELLGKYNLNPEETLFIDDSYPNIEMAQKLGIKTLYLNDYNELDRKLKEIKELKQKS